MTPDDPGQHRQRPWNSGLQPERTSLAWQRVNLAGLAATLVSARMLIETHATLGYIVAVVGATTAAALTVAHSRRLRRTNQALFDVSPLPDGRVHVLALAMLVLVAVVGLIFVLTDSA